jgi:tetratricopeptide (TPR) repeat protein
MKIIVIILFGISFSSAKIYSNNLFNHPSDDCDSLQLLTKYSLFSEYHKNKDFKSALPYGWQVLECNPDKFRKWIYYKMEDALWYIHDSTEVSEEMKNSLSDTTIYVYNLAIEHYPEEKAYFQSHKAFIYEIWFKVPDELTISEYEKAIEYSPDLSSYYYDRLAKIYSRNMSDDNDYQSKAIDIYSMLQDREPDNPQWPIELEKLVQDMGQLVMLTKKNWENDKANLTKAWKYASTAMKAEMYIEAIEGLEFLVNNSPETINYWNQLATAYQKINMLNKAENALLKLIEIDPQSKEHYFNLGIVYSDQGKYPKSRSNYIKASEIGGGWALPIFYEGYLYEKAASNCANDFDKKIVYQVALDTYRKAARLDPNLQQAQNRINALSTSVPTQEDYFFRGYKSGDVIQVSNSCPEWIGKSITVP